MLVHISSYDPSSGKLEGRVEWPTLNSVTRIEGELRGSTISFREVEFIKQGQAGLGCLYELQTWGGGKLIGRWAGCPGSDYQGSTELDRQ
jgi:hypothetical protein